MPTTDTARAEARKAALIAAGKSPRQTRSMVHVIGDSGACVECGNDHVTLRHQYGESQLVYLQRGSLVHWVITVPGEGPIDETFAESKAAAHNFARELHGKRARVALDWTQLEVAEPRTIFWLEETHHAGPDTAVDHDELQVGDEVDAFIGPMTDSTTIAWWKALQSRQTFEEEADGYSRRAEYSHVVLVLRTLANDPKAGRTVDQALGYTSPQVLGAEIITRHGGDSAATTLGWVEAATDLDYPESANTVRFTVRSN